ncbi:TPR repeat region-containing protein [Streptomyces harbinensis]|uniref:Uncharacterized protein n=1 Tax=Streptomyces harbinensis TaxID=1176198 RepID=A0A1I6PVQ8_9ACTN|nr:hypothetical protein [Streptomyces harbinensis]SFS44331.1 hypothetical protein SAMN05444716_101759 [Streptomyces harbinensis]
MGDISITKDDVIEAAGCDPWELQSDFASDTDLESMMALSGVFKTGAGEADEAGGVAAYASSVEEEAGTDGGGALYAEAAEHLTSTYEDLGAESLEAVARILDQIADEAETVLETNEEAITGATGLDWQREESESDANSDFGAFQTWLSSKSGVDKEEDISYTVYGETFSGRYESFPTGNVKSHIRTAHLDAVADIASEVHTGITERLDDYYGLLHLKEGELGEYGYDVRDSPVEFWYTETRAEHEAQKLLEVMAGDPTPEELERYTSGVNSIMEQVYDENGERVGTLTKEQRAFLSAYYDALGVDGIAALGSDERQVMAGAQEIVANGIMTMYNIEAGGFPSAMSPGAPESVRHLVMELEVGTENAPGFQSVIGYDPETGEFVLSGLAEYQGFSKLLEHSSVEAGMEFTQQLGESALRVQQGINTVIDLSGLEATDPNGQIPLELTDLEFITESLREIDTGANGMLEVVSRNVDGSQLFLLNENNLETMMGMEWRGLDDGAVSVLENAAERAQDDPIRAERAARIAQSALLTIGESPETWRSLIPKGSDMSNALTSVAAQYIDAFANDMTAPGEGPYDAGLGPDGLYQSGFLLPGLGEGGMNFLDFVGMGLPGGEEDWESYMLDTDFATLHIAAREHASDRFAAALEEGDGFGAAEQFAANLYGNLGHAEVRGALNFTENEYQAQVLAQERQKMLTSLVFDTALSGNPVGSAIKTVAQGPVESALNAAWSNVQKQVQGKVEEALDLSAPDAGAVAQIRNDAMTDVLDTARLELNHIALEALVEAGQANTSSERAQQLLDGDGNLRPYSEISETSDLRALANDVYNSSEVTDLGATIQLDDTRMEIGSGKFLNHLNSVEASAYSDPDKELVNSIVYGNTNDTSYTPAYSRAANQDWNR